MTVDGSAGPQFVNADSRARSAAVLHEVLEDFQEETGISWKGNNEAIPMFAEFLFTGGDSRLNDFYSFFTESLKADCTDKHYLAWRIFGRFFEEGDSREDSEARFRSILKKRKAMNEATKTDLVKSAIKACEEKTRLD